MGDHPYHTGGAFFRRRRPPITTYRLTIRDALYPKVRRSVSPHEAAYLLDIVVSTCEPNINSRGDGRDVSKVNCGIMSGVSWEIDPERDLLE